MTKIIIIFLVSIGYIFPIGAEPPPYRPYFPISKPVFNRPVIHKAEPSSFVQAPPGLSDATNTLTLFGEDLWPKQDPRFGYDVRRTRLLLKRNANYVEITGYSTGNDKEEKLQTLTFQFSSRQFLADAGTLEVVIEVDGKASSGFSIPVLPPPSLPPIIANIDPNKFGLLNTLPRGEDPQHAYHFRLTGSSFDALDQMSLLVGGIAIPIKKLSIKNGELEATVPQVYWSRPGDYGVKLSNRRGVSQTYIITIVAPPKPKLPAARPVPSKEEVKGDVPKGS
jgi:hypothetical protein